MTASSHMKDYAAAGVVILFGAGFAAIAVGYPLGRMLRPGPGFYPLVIGLLLVLFGLLILIETWIGLRATHESPPDEGVPAAERIGWRAVVSVTIGMLAFAFLVDKAGYVVATFALVFISAIGEARRNWWAIGAVALFMAVLGSLLFIWGLGLPVNAFGPR